MLKLWLFELGKLHYLGYVAEKDIQNSEEMILD